MSSAKKIKSKKVSKKNGKNDSFIKGIPPGVKELKRAVSLIKQLFRLKIVQIFTVFMFVILTLPLLYFWFKRPHIQKDINYGITFSNKYATEIGLDWKETYLKILDDLKVKNVRLIVYWDETEPVNDRYNFEIIKWQMDEAQKRDVKVILTLGRKVPRWPECFEPDWWKEMTGGEKKKLELYEFVERTVVELKAYDNIVMWQVENEPFFPFGVCENIDKEDVGREVDIVRLADEKSRPILIQDSGEGGFWLPSFLMGDYLAISMYRKIWYDFWGVILGRSIYFKYPLSHWTYKIKADLVGVPYQKIIVTELQAEPWGPSINSELSEEERDKSMSRNDFLSTLSYAQKAGFKDLYLWGAEWWLWEKEVRGNPFYWDTAKALFN